MRISIILITSIGLSLPGVHAQDPSVVDDASVRAAVDRSVALLLTLQERYEADRPVGRLEEDELPTWQARERKRLASLRGEVEGEGEEWPYEGVYRVGNVIPAGYRVGGTAIVCEALVLAPGFEEDAPRREAVQRSLAFLARMLEEDSTLAPGPKTGYDVRGWGHAYALGFFLTVLEKGLATGTLRQRIEVLLPHLVHCLDVNETRQGGWNYANDRLSPFQTAATLLVLYRARAAGLNVPEAMVERALDALERGRNDNGAYAYSGRGRQEPAASAARSSAAELALFHAGRSDPGRLASAVEAFLVNYPELLKRKSQQGTHAGPYAIAPYYFFFGHTYAAWAIERLPAAEREAYRQRLRRRLWETREEDGGWNDRIFPRTQGYSTAMVVLALQAKDVTIPTWPFEKK